MTFLKRLFLKASELPAFNIALILFLMTLALVKSMALALLDTGTVAWFLAEHGLLRIGFDFILLGVLMSFIGREVLLLKRRRGYGVLRVFVVSVLLVTVGLLAADAHGKGGTDILLVIKYAVFILLNIAFWVITARFIPMRLDSLKFSFVMGAELLGYAIGGLAAFLFDSTSVLVCTALFLLIAVSIGVGVLCRLILVPEETFVRRKNGIPNGSEQKLAFGILLTGFVFMMARCLMDFSFYGMLDTTENLSPIRQVGLLWTAFGLGTFALLTALYRTRFLYTLFWGMIVLGFSLLLAAFGVATGVYECVFAGVVLFMIMSHLYAGSYFKLMPVPLRLIPRKVGMERLQLCVAEPCGFILGATLISFVMTATETAFLLLGVGLVFYAVLFIAMWYYAALVLNLFQLRIWRAGPFLLVYPKILRYVKEQLKTDNAEDMIYFLRILESAHHKLFLPTTLKSLKHKAETVRIFALQRLSRQHNAGRYTKVIEGVFQRDESRRVRQEALSILIVLDCAQNPDGGATKYEHLLDDKGLKIGAIVGFLKVGGAPAMMAMDGLQKMVFSRKVKHNLAALNIMRDAPSFGLVRLVLPLLQSTNPLIAKQALITAGAVQHPMLLPYVLNALDEPDLRENALYALDRYAKSAFPSIEKMIGNPAIPSVRQKVLIAYLSNLSSGEGKQILLRQLQSGNQKLRKNIVLGMIDSGIFWVHKGKQKMILKGLKRDIDRWNWLNGLLTRYAQSPTPESQDAFAFLTRALSEDLNGTRQLILYQLLLMKNNPLFVKAVRILLENNAERHAAALGMLQDLLPHRLYRKIKTIVEFADVGKKETVRPYPVEEAVADISQLLTNSPFYVASWVKASALYCLRKLDLPEALPAVRVALSDKDPVVLESAIWAFAHLEKDKEIVHQTVLTMPTSILAHVPMERLIES